MVYVPLLLSFKGKRYPTVLLEMYITIYKKFVTKTPLTTILLFCMRSIRPR